MADMMLPGGPPGPGGPSLGGPPPGGLPGGPPGMPPGPGGPPGGPPGGIGGKMSAMKSLFNPADIAAMLQRGEITPQTKFVELLAKMGISPDDTIMQVVQKTMGEAQKADPLQKMKAFAPPGAPPAPPPGPGGPGGPGGLPPMPAGPSTPGSVDKLFGS